MERGHRYHLIRKKKGNVEQWDGIERGRRRRKKRKRKKKKGLGHVLKLQGLIFQGLR